MKTAISIFGVIVMIVCVGCNSTRDAVNLCYQQTITEDGADVCYALKSSCTRADFNEWVFLYNDTRKLRDLSWENRRFTCFHACMMVQRGEMENGKIILEKYVDNLAEDYNLILDEDSTMQINECGLKANTLDDECTVAAKMGECVTEKWDLIEKGLYTK